MKALEVTVDGQRVCSGGLPEFGVVTCIITGVRRLAVHAEDGQDEPEWTHHINVGGIHEPEPGTKESLDWYESDLRVGQSIVMRLVEVDEVDEPKRRRRETKGDVIEMKRNYLDHLKQQIAEVTADLESAE